MKIFLYILLYVQIWIFKVEAAAARQPLFSFRLSLVNLVIKTSKKDIDNIEGTSW